MRTGKNSAAAALETGNIRSGGQKSPGASAVAVVDDDPLFVRALCTNLEGAGVVTLPFAGGHPLLDYVKEGCGLAAIILDWHMPDLGGPDVLRRLRELDCDAPVLFLTGHSEPVYEEAALAGGAVDFVDKSRSFAVILQRLRIALAGVKGPATAENPKARTPGARTLEYDANSARIYWRSRRVELTLTEVRVVQLMASRGGSDVTYREIYDIVRGEGFVAGNGEEGYRANVRALIKRIRQKFRALDPEFAALENYPGFGYRWNDASGG